MWNSVANSFFLRKHDKFCTKFIFRI
uniref:Uncharacterized protein n=1 Tax=Arundo donax TaxID=35708 RepID=A0A0A8YI04_ARUDO